MREKINELVEAIEARTYGTGVSVQATEITKNNGTVKSAIRVRPNGTMVAKVIYVDNILDMMERGEIDREEAAEEFEEVYRMSGNAGVNDVEKMIEVMEGGKESILDCVRHQVVSKEWNKGSADKYAHRDYLDFMVLYTVTVGECSTKITHEQMEAYGISLEELEKNAKKNDSKEEYGIVSMCEILREMGEYIPEDALPNMYVCTNKRRINGATIILDTQRIEELSKDLDSDLFIIPSSIHEVLAVPVMGEKEMFNSMVQEVNANEVDAEERLSNHVYYYKRGSMELSVE